ncbi:putative zinc finger protein [Orchesella cincta]|uniref:Putative zinc finger protein n=1 Tax=Orchesella cincta TaxID=48709 RepID=A0A1D2MMR4_ORCCI|nr:putative zinc finger protein [Orchesella cincta]
MGCNSEMGEQQQQPPNNNERKKSDIFCNIKFRDPTTWHQPPPLPLEKKVQVLEAEVVLLKHSCEDMRTTISELSKAVETLKDHMKDPLGCSCSMKPMKRSWSATFENGGEEEERGEPNRSRFKQEDTEEVFNHICQLCSKKFQYEAGLETHMEVHASHECGYCEQRFLTPSLLKMHMTTHNDEMPNLCNQCGKRFGLKQSLHLHQKLLHSEEETTYQESFRNEEQRDQTSGTPPTRASNSSSVGAESTEPLS